MTYPTIDRRSFLTLGSLAALALPAVAHGLEANPAPKRRILCVGAHPDDPESGCGGTLALLAQAGHAVTCCYLTTGEAGIAGKSHAEAAGIRRAEAETACRLLGVRAVFAGQIDGATVVDATTTAAFAALVRSEAPDIVFTHWPMDSHRDHQAAALLTLRAWMEKAPRFECYFYEVCIGMQTMGFHPTDWVDISTTQILKRTSVDCHRSQNPASIYAAGHTTMEEFRGRELGVKAAEAFVRLTGRQQARALT